MIKPFWKKTPVERAKDHIKKMEGANYWQRNQTRDSNISTTDKVDHMIKELHQVISSARLSRKEGSMKAVESAIERASMISRELKNYGIAVYLNTNTFELKIIGR